MKRDNFVSIEFADAYIKLLRVRIQRGQPVLVQADVVRLEGPDEASIVRALTQLLSNKVVEAPVVLIPGRHAILRRIRLPSHSDEEIHRMIGLQIAHLSPFAPDEIIYDHIVLDKNASGYTAVLVVIVQKEHVRHFLRALEKKGLVPRRLALGSQGVLNWSVYQRKAAGLSGADGMMFVDVDHDNTEICFCRDDKLFFSRNIRYGDRDLGQDQMDLFIEQIGLTLGTYRKEQLGPPVGRFVVIANSPRRALLTEKLEEYYRLPVDALYSLDHVPCDKGLALPVTVKTEGISLTRALGFLLGTSAPSVNLMPRDVLDTQVTRTQRKVVLQFLSVLFLTFLLGFGVFSTRLYSDRLRLEKIEQKIVETETLVNKSQKEMNILRAFEEQQQKRVILTDVLQELYQLTPRDISFHSLSLDAQGNFNIQGYASTGSLVNLFQNRLVGSKLFKNVNLQYATKRIRFREEYTEFKIVCQLDVGGGAHDL